MKPKKIKKNYVGIFISKVNIKIKVNIIFLLFIIINIYTIAQFLIHANFNLNNEHSGTHLDKFEILFVD